MPPCRHGSPVQVAVCDPPRQMGIALGIHGRRVREGRPRSPGQARVCAIFMARFIGAASLEQNNVWPSTGDRHREIPGVAGRHRQKACEEQTQQPRQVADCKAGKISPHHRDRGYCVRQGLPVTRGGKRKKMPDFRHLPGCCGECVCQTTQFLDFFLKWHDTCMERGVGL